VYALKQSTGISVTFFSHDVNGDAVTGKVDGDFTKRISKNAGAFAAMTVTITEMENGWYSMPLSSAHTDTLGVLSVSLSATGIKRVNLVWRVDARVADDFAYPTTSGRAMDVDASGGVEVGSFQAGAITAAAIADAAIDRATFAADTGLQTTRSGTAQAGAAGTITLDASASGTDDFYNDQWIYLTGATGAGQSRRISDYVGASKIASVEPNWITNPDSSTTFAIIRSGRVDVGAWLGAIVNALISGRVDASAGAVGSGAITAASFAAGAIDANAIAADAIGSSELATSAVNEIRDGVWGAAMVELAAVPGVTASVMEALEWLFLLARNKRTCTATTELLRNDADGATIGTSTVSDDSTTAIRGKFT
jgi:hypothetical protein